MTQKTYINWKVLESRQNQPIIEQHLTDYTNWLHTNNINKSRDYANTVRRLLIQQQILPHQLQPQHIDNFLNFLTEQTTHKHTLHIYISRLRKWLAFLKKPYADLLTAPSSKRRIPLPHNNLPPQLTKQLTEERKEYIDTLRTFERANSTLETYNNVIQLFQTLIPKPTSELTKQDLLDFINQLHKRNTAPQTINHYRRITRLYLKHYNQDHLYKTIPTLKRRRPLKRTAPFDDTKILIAESKQDIYPPYLHPILALITFTGIRIGTILKVQIHQLDLENHWISFWTKGDIEQKLPFNEKIAPILQDYINKNQPTNYLFPRNTHEPNTALTTDKLRHWLRILSRNTNLPYYNPHAYRRAMATHIYYKSGENLVFTKTFLNHANVQTTLEYIDIDYDTMQQTYNTITQSLSLEILS